MWKEFNLILEAVKTGEVPCNFLPFETWGGGGGGHKTGKFAFVSVFASLSFLSSLLLCTIY
jgi:hypothetical protein